MRQQQVLFQALEAQEADLVVQVERPLVVLPFQALEGQVGRHREVPMRQQQVQFLALAAYQVEPEGHPLVVLPFQALVVLPYQAVLEGHPLVVLPSQALAALEACQAVQEERPLVVLPLVVLPSQASAALPYQAEPEERPLVVLPSQALVALAALVVLPCQVEQEVHPWLA